MQGDSKRKCNLLLIRWDLAIYDMFLPAFTSQPLNWSSILSLFIENCRHLSDSPLKKTKEKATIILYDKWESWKSYPRWIIKAANEVSRTFR